MKRKTITSIMKVFAAIMIVMTVVFLIAPIL